MLNPLSFFSKIIKSSNQKELDKISKIVTKINSLEETVKDLKNEDFPKKTEQFKERIKNGETLDKFFLRPLHLLEKPPKEREMKGILMCKLSVA